MHCSPYFIQPNVNNIVRSQVAVCQHAAPDTNVHPEAV